MTGSARRLLESRHVRFVQQRTNLDRLSPSAQQRSIRVRRPPLPASQPVWRCIGGHSRCNWHRDDCGTGRLESTATLHWRCRTPATPAGGHRPSVGSTTACLSAPRTRSVAAQRRDHSPSRIAAIQPHPACQHPPRPNRAIARSRHAAGQHRRPRYQHPRPDSSRCRANQTARHRARRRHR